MNNREYIEKLTNDALSGSIEYTVDNFTRFLYDNACEIFGKTCDINRNEQNRKINNKWFDLNCYNAKREFKIARNNFNRTKNNESRKTFIHSRTKYNKIKQKAKRNFKIKEGHRIHNLEKKQPRKFWKNIKKYYQKTNVSSETLTVNELYDHF